MESLESGRYACLCCGFLSLAGEEPPPGTFEICEVCGWEDDTQQFDVPPLRGGANELSLNEVRAAFQAWAADGYPPDELRRPPKLEEIPATDPDS